MKVRKKMKWICKKCGNVMEAKTTLVKTMEKRYIVNCQCTEGLETDKKAREFQSKNWIEYKKIRNKGGTK